MGTPLRVLTVEDSADDAALVLLQLRRAGYEVTHQRVETPADMADALDRLTWDVIISDYQLPQFNGLAALRLLQASGQDIPFIIVSGTIGEDIAVAAMKAGAHDYLMKGNLARLTVAIEREVKDAITRRARNQAETALRQREQEMKSLLDNLPDIIARFDRQLRYIYINPVIEAKTGLPPAFFLGKTTSQVSASASEGQHRDESIRRVFETAQGTTFEFSFQSLRDGLRCYESNIVPEFGPDGTVQSVLSIARDITERKQTEEALRASEAQLSLLVNSLPMAVYSARAEGDLGVIWASDSTERLSGFTPKCFTDDADFWASRLHPADREPTLQGIPRLFAQGRLSSEYRWQCADGQYRWFFDQVVLLRNADGSPRELIGVWLDVTERKQREREMNALISIAAALRTADSTATMQAVIIQNVVDLLQAESAALLQHTSDQQHAQVSAGHGRWVSLIGQHIPESPAMFGHLLNTNQPRILNSLTPPPPMVAEWFEGLHGIAAAPLIAKGQVIGTLWIGRPVELLDKDVRLLTALADIAANALQRASVIETLEQRVADRTCELTVANAKLQELDRLKDQFVANVSHELRTPLTSIMLQLDLLERGRAEKTAQYLATLRREANRLRQMIEDLLDLSRLDRQVEPIECGTTDLNALFAQLIADRTPLAVTHGLRLDFLAGLELPAAQADARLVTQVFSNLLTNALNYTPAGGVISVMTAMCEHAGADWVTCTVRDTGPGIAAKDLPHLFERFYRGEVGRKASAPGTGLGLAICQEILTQLNGRLTVESEPGYGAAFTIWLRPSLAA